MKEEGPRAIYKGLVPGLQRQSCFCTVRIGSYDSVKNSYTKALHNGKLHRVVRNDLFCQFTEKATIGVRVMAGVTTGIIGIAMAQPTEVVKIRLQGQSTAVKKRYAGTMDAYRKITRTEGIRGLWKGIDRL